MPGRAGTTRSALALMRSLTVRALEGVLTVDVPTLCRALSANSERICGS